MRLKQLGCLVLAMAAPVSCPLVLVRDVVQTYQDLTGEASHKGNKTWFLYVEKLILTRLRQYREVNGTVSLHLKKQSKATTSILYFLHKIAVARKYTQDMGPLIEKLCTAPFQVVKEYRTIDSCHETYQLHMCSFWFTFMLHQKLRLNITFKKLKMINSMCRMNGIRMTQYWRPFLKWQEYCGTYTPFTIYSKYNHVRLIYRYDMEGNYQSLFVFSVFDPGVAFTFPGQFEIEHLPPDTSSRKFLLCQMVMTKTGDYFAVHSYHVYFIPIFSLLLDMVKTCRKGRCWFTPTPYHHLLTPFKPEMFVPVRGPQCLLFIIFNTSIPYLYHTINSMPVRWKPVLNKIKSISLPSGKKEIFVFNDTNQDQVAQVWNITAQGNTSEASVEVLISNMAYKETLLLSQPPECFFGGLVVYDYHHNHEDPRSPEDRLTVCGDFIRYVGNRRVYSSEKTLLLVFLQYFPHSSVTAELEMTTQSCKPVFLHACSGRYMRYGTFTINPDNDTQLDYRLSKSRSALVAKYTADQKGLILSTESPSKCVVIVLESEEEVIERGIDRCYLKIKPKDVLSASGARLSMWMEGTFLSYPKEFRIHTQPNVHFNLTSSFAPLSEVETLRIFPSCTKSKFHFLWTGNCELSESFEKITAYSFTDAPFHSDDLTVEMIVLPYFRSWLSIKFYHQWFPANRSFEFAEVPKLFKSDLRKPMENLQLPFPTRVRVWSPSEVMDHEFFSQDASLVLRTIGSGAVTFNLSLMLKFWKEVRMKHMDTKLFVNILWNKSSSETISHATGDHLVLDSKKLFLSLQGDVPQLLFAKPRDETLFIYLVHNIFSKTMPSHNFSQESGRNYNVLCFNFTQQNKAIAFLEEASQDRCARSLVPWTKAESACRSINSTLPILRSKAEQDELVSIVKISKEIRFIPGVYIGIKKAGQSEVR